jgi:hypothetical protein
MHDREIVERRGRAGRRSSSRLGAPVTLLPRTPFSLGTLKSLWTSKYFISPHFLYTYPYIQDAVVLGTIFFILLCCIHLEKAHKSFQVTMSTTFVPNVDGPSLASRPLPLIFEVLQEDYFANMVEVCLVYVVLDIMRGADTR